MSESSDRSKVERCSREIGRLQTEKARYAKRIADLVSKVAYAQQSMSRTSSASTVRSKLQEIDRSQSEIARQEATVASLERKIADQHKELASAQESLAREQRRAGEQRRRDEERATRERERRAKRMEQDIAHHRDLHLRTAAALDQLRALPTRITVLFLASNPVDQTELRLDEEVRAIAETIRKSKHRDSVDLRSCWAVRPGDLIQAINEHRPTVVHFSGHGSDQDEIVFQDDRGRTKLVSKDAIAQLMRACSGDIRLVFFNTCYSRDQAEAVVEHVDAAIGMNTTVGDAAARVFAAQFYSSVGFGLSVAQAFEQAKAALMLEGIREEDSPELFVRAGRAGSDVVLVGALEQPLRPDSADF